MAKFRQRPLGGGVALGAIIAKEADVPVLRLVAGRAVEQGLFALQMRIERWGVDLFEPGDESSLRWIVGGRKLFQADAREGGVIHLCRADDSALVFQMALTA